MDKCRNLTTCSLELLDDPLLKTTAANYDFKYVPGEQFQRVIRTVQRDRLKHKKDSVWSEFCNTKMRPTVVNAKESDPASKYSNKAHENSRNVIKTKKSTIKIISHPMVDNKVESPQTPSSQETYKTYKIPKVRIMTDEEIKNVVETAFKEVIEQTGSKNIISQLLTNRDDANTRPDAENSATEENITDPLVTENAFESTQAGTARSIKSAKSVTAFQQDETSHAETQRKESSETNNAEKFEERKSSTNSSGRSNASVKSNESSKSGQRSNISMKQAPGNGVSPLSNNSIAKDKDGHEEEEQNGDDEEENGIAPLNLIPALTCIEKEEMRKLLGIQELIVSPEINLDCYRRDSSSSENEEKNGDDQPDEVNITRPMVHIRYQTPIFLDEGDFIRPIESYSSIPETYTQAKQDSSNKIQSTRTARSATPRVRKSPPRLPSAKIPTVRTPTPRLPTPRVASSRMQISQRRSPTQRVATPRVLTPRAATPRAPVSQVPTPRASTQRSPALDKNLNNSPKKSSVKSPEKASRVSLIPPNLSTTPRSPRKTKIVKSPDRATEARQHELKLENVTILTKIRGYQQKIIQAIEHIGENLNHIPEPDGHLDVKRRERRAEEFIARFCRNYLYQIGRLTEEIRLVPKDLYLSKADNDFPLKVCNLFNILSQAIQSYQKHMNSFIVDPSPKKLSSLIECIAEATKMCVHKKIFEKVDPTVQELLRKMKHLKTFLADAEAKMLEMPPPKQKKSKSVKVIKSAPSALKKAKTLSMYDTVPESIAGVKRKGYSLKGTARSKASVRSLVVKSSCDSRLGLQKLDKKPSKKASSVKVASKDSVPPPPAPSKAKVCISEHKNKDDALSFKTPRIDDVRTVIENIEADDIFEDDLHLMDEYVTEDIMASVNMRQNTNTLQGDDRQKFGGNTALNALASVTNQQLQQILSPLMSTLEMAMSNQASGSGGVDINTILNNLILSHLTGVGGFGGTGPATTGKEIFNQQDQDGNDINNDLRNDTTNYTFNIGQANDNNANCERELAVQNQKRLHETQPRAAPAPPNTFSIGELNNHDDTMAMTSSQQPMPTVATNEYSAGVTIQSRETITTGPRVRADNAIFAEGNVSDQDERYENGEFGATESEIQTKKVQNLRYDRNVQFTIVTTNEHQPTEITRPDESKVLRPDVKSNIHRPNVLFADDANGNIVADIKERITEKEFIRDKTQQLRDQRNHFMDQAAESPLYGNEYFNQPWIMVTNLSRQIVEDAINDVEKTINFGEETFVRDFIQMELES